MSDNQTIVKLDSVVHAIPDVNYKLLGNANRADLRLMLLTAVAESAHTNQNYKQVMFYNKQIRGPAVSPWQVEPVTAKDVLIRYYGRKPHMMDNLISLVSEDYNAEDVYYNLEHLMLTNVKFACAIARGKYLLVPASIPDSIDGAAWYWKQHYNTHLGKGTVKSALSKWKLFSGDELLNHMCI